MSLRVLDLFSGIGLEAGDMKDKPQMKTYTLCNGEVVSIWGCSGEWYSVDEVDARIAELEDKLDIAEDKLHRIASWANAYPEDVFIPPTAWDFAEARRLLGDNRWSSLNGHWARHLLSGVRKALEEER